MQENAPCTRALNATAILLPEKCNYILITSVNLHCCPVISSVQHFVPEFRHVFLTNHVLNCNQRITRDFIEVTNSVNISLIEIVPSTKRVASTVFGI